MEDACRIVQRHRGTSAFKVGIVNSYAAARPRAKKPIKPRPKISIAYIWGSETRPLLFGLDACAPTASKNVYTPPLVELGGSNQVTRTTTDESSRGL